MVGINGLSPYRLLGQGVIVSAGALTGRCNTISLRERRLADLSRALFPPVSANSILMRLSRLASDADGTQSVLDAAMVHLGTVQANGATPETMASALRGEAEPVHLSVIFDEMRGYTEDESPSVVAAVATLGGAATVSLLFGAEAHYRIMLNAGGFAALGLRLPERTEFLPVGLTTLVVATTRRTGSDFQPAAVRKTAPVGVPPPRSAGGPNAVAYIM